MLHCLKKIVCAFLLAILVFNWCGYRILAFYLEGKANALLQAKLDNDDYDHSELISIKIPSSHLSYYYSSKEFYNMDGEIEMDGIFYKFVKRRLYNDTLEFLCLPNKEAMALFNAKSDFFKRVNDIQQTGQEKKNQPHPAGSKNTMSEYCLYHDALTCDLYFSLLPRLAQKDKTLLSCFSPVPDKPPQFS